MSVAGRRRAKSGVSRVKREKKATALETARRVDIIVGVMQRDEWRPGESAPALAAEWKVSPSTVENLSSEASRRVAFIAQLAGDPDKLKSDVTSVLLRSLHAAHDERARGDVARIGDIVTKIAGARAPEHHKVDLSVKQYESLEPAQMLARIRDQRTKLDEAERVLIEEHPELGSAEKPCAECGFFGGHKVECSELERPNADELRRDPFCPSELRRPGGIEPFLSPTNVAERTSENPGACCFVNGCTLQPGHPGEHRL